MRPSFRLASEGAAASPGRDHGAKQPRKRGGTVQQAENAVCRCDEETGKCDALRFVRVEQERLRSPADHHRELPCQVYGVADPGVHPLTPTGLCKCRCLREERRTLCGTRSLRGDKPDTSRTIERSARSYAARSPSVCAPTPTWRNRRRRQQRLADEPCRALALHRHHRQRVARGHGDV